MIEIILSERDFDHEIQSLVNSFFPGQRSQIRIWPDQSAEEIMHLADPTVFSVGAWMGRTRIQAWFCVDTECFRSDHRGDTGDDAGNCSVSPDGGDSGHGSVLLRQAELSVPGGEDFHKHADKTPHPYRFSYKNKLKGLLFDLLSGIDPEQLPAGMRFCVPAWGTMTGVRPTKIALGQLLSGRSEDEVCRCLREEYRCTEEKADLCAEIAVREMCLLQQAGYEDGYCLYVGIPFCPTTCLYCSFPSYPLERLEALVPAYLEALKKEIRSCGEQMKGKRLTAVYIGGGTPAALTADQMRGLLSCIQQELPVHQALEVTVEAGRPDCITREKLSVLSEGGVGRICVNPQTMQDVTLKRIGRRHTVQQVRKAFALARECGFSDINMDLIVGLPGEGEADLADTLRQIGELGPDSVTIHSLVVKRASRLREMLDAADGAPERELRMEEMLALGLRFARQHGYQPYYMYRQKNSAGYAGSSGQENIGSARPGKECLYNVLMMEEKQSILAVGAGGISKRIGPGTIRRCENVKDVAAYIDRIDEMIKRKRLLFTAREQ